MALDYSRIHRLLRILTLVQSGSRWTAQSLAEELGVTVRTIYRDMRMLEAAGIPYFFDRDRKSYAIRRDFFMPPVQLTLDESLALIALGQLVGDDEQIPLTRAAARVIAKVRSHLPPQIRDEIGDVEQHLFVRLAQSGPHEGIDDVYEQMREAIRKRRALSCRYDSVGNKQSVASFEFHPYSLLFAQRAWYVLGHHNGRGEIRCLKLNRFDEIQQTSKSYKIPKDFSVKQYLGNAWRMIRGKKSYNVELLFDAGFAETIEDTRWHETQETEWQDDGSLIFRCKVDGLDEIVWWVLSMGPHCLVRKPTELAKRVGEMAVKTAALYRNSSLRAAVK